jgi:sulfur carrier protein ThiS
MKETILVKVYLHSTLIKYSPDGTSRKLQVSIDAGSTLDDLINSLGIDQTEYPLLLAVNGKVAEEFETLEESDLVHLMMPISGG